MAVMLVVGLFAGAAFFSTETEVEVQLPGEVVYEDKIVEVEICGELCECPVCEDQDLLQLAVEDFMKAVEDEEVELNGEEINLLKVDGTGHEYDFDEISISKVYDDYTIDYDRDEAIVTFDIKLKYKEDGEESKKVKYNVEVVFEEDEDTEVTILEE